MPLVYMLFMYIYYMLGICTLGAFIIVLNYTGVWSGQDWSCDKAVAGTASFQE